MAAAVPGVPLLLPASPAPVLRSLQAVTAITTAMTATTARPQSTAARSTMAAGLPISVRGRAMNIMAAAAMHPTCRSPHRRALGNHDVPIVHRPPSAADESFVTNLL